ncbi:hypothetical protein [Lactobacillus helveticus]|uniref:Uncharacterized protein n=1 Tax=Lactobacillus helveticus TaxID=1587 RepID=A0A3Q8SUC6_LACHE|nr:hypothetical protein [Lactobacillus helveticus]AFR22706.1 hypothetical protein R0052_09925 [Lactobacillus helveticus R0052]AZK91393.1 hypothetical protein LH5_01151 [Lactobacillus helveticus]MCJ2191184.1 hypothetical protein [Lactobacillus helveticus]MED7629066.1 hypothetical protein [Lactobacillus helveticus]MZR06694.1 hypothetical protein [Lactobacillus helveticus]
MLERYFKTKQDFDKYLDKTYDPDTFEKSFEQFLNSLVSSSYTLDIKVNNFNNNEGITNNTSVYKMVNNLNNKTIFENEDSFSFN